MEVEKREDKNLLNDENDIWSFLPHYSWYQFTVVFLMTPFFYKWVRTLSRTL